MTSADVALPPEKDIQTSLVRTDLSARDQSVASDTVKPAADMSIDPENEVTGFKLLLIHIGICLSTWLIGLVRHYSLPSRLIRNIIR